MTIIRANATDREAGLRIPEYAKPFYMTIQPPQGFASIGFRTENLIPDTGVALRVAASKTGAGYQVLLDDRTVESLIIALSYHKKLKQEAGVWNADM